MTLPTNPANETCKACSYNRVSPDGLHEDCDPPTGECPLEGEPWQHQVDPRVVNINGEDVIARYAFDEY